MTLNQIKCQTCNQPYTGTLMYECIVKYEGGTMDQHNMCNKCVSDILLHGSPGEEIVSCVISLDNYVQEAM